MKRQRQRQQEKQKQEENLEHTPAPLPHPVCTRRMRRRAQAQLNQEVDVGPAFDILYSRLKSEERSTIARLLRNYYPSVLNRDVQEDPWPLEVDSSGMLRWQEDPMVAQLVASHYDALVPGDRLDYMRARRVNDMAPLSLNKLAFSRQAGHYPPHLFRRLMKRIGYSLQGYYELDPWYECELVEAQG